MPVPETFVQVPISPAAGDEPDRLSFGVQTVLLPAVAVIDLLITTTSSLNEQPFLVTVHVNTLDPGVMPVIALLFKVGVEILPVPEVLVQTPVPPLTITEFRFVLSEQMVKGKPASTLKLLLLTIRFTVLVQPLLVTVHTKVLLPDCKPVTAVL